MATLNYSENQSDHSEVLLHLEACDRDFYVPLSERVNLAKYSEKLIGHSFRLEAWDSTKLVGLAAMYLDEQHASSFLTSLSVCPGYQQQGIAKHLLSRCKSVLRGRNIVELQLEAAAEDATVQGFYRSQGFEVILNSVPHQRMSCYLTV